MANETTTVDLINIIDEQMENVHTRSLDISFNELQDMHKNEELNITLDYQRLFQWTEEARSRFIESLLLEMPVPPIFVIEEEEGKYDLIDGLQRISSYLHLRGELEADHLDPPVKYGDKLVLTGCDIVKELNGKMFDDLGTTLQIRLKRAFIRVEVVRKGSNPRFKYYMFKRLNTGGELLSDQQIRNCTIRLLDTQFNDFIIELSKEEVFKRTISTITSKRRLRAFDQELVLRYFALKNYRRNFKGYLGDFLTRYMEVVSDSELSETFDYEQEKTTFIKTFAILDKCLGEVVFSYYDRRSGSLPKAFSANNFEAFSVGLQSFADKIDIEDKDLITTLKETFVEIKQNDSFIEVTAGGGKNSPGNVNKRIEIVEQKIREVL